MRKDDSKSYFQPISSTTQPLAQCLRSTPPSFFPPSLLASPRLRRQLSYDEKTDVYSLGMLLFEMCHPPFGTKMERAEVLTKAHRLQFPAGNVWGPREGQEAMKNMCRSMLQEQSGKRPSAADIVRQVCIPACVWISVFCWSDFESSTVCLRRKFGGRAFCWVVVVVVVVVVSSSCCYCHCYCTLPRMQDVVAANTCLPTSERQQSGGTDAGQAHGAAA